MNTSIFTRHNIVIRDKQYQIQVTAELIDTVVDVEAAVAVLTEKVRAEVLAMKTQLDVEVFCRLLANSMTAYCGAPAMVSLLTNYEQPLPAEGCGIVVTPNASQFARESRFELEGPIKGEE